LTETFSSHSLYHVPMKICAFLTLDERGDFVRDDAGDFAVMEQELIEPSLYLRMNPDAPGRFARAIDQWFS